MSCDSHTHIGIKGHRLKRKVPKEETKKERNKERKTATTKH
jgi:hypothetical protein